VKYRSKKKVRVKVRFLGYNVFERGKNVLQNGIMHFCRQKSRLMLELRQTLLRVT